MNFSNNRIETLAVISMFPAKGLRKKEKPGNETAAVCGVSNTH